MKSTDVKIFLLLLFGTSLKLYFIEATKAPASLCLSTPLSAPQDFRLHSQSQHGWQNLPYFSSTISKKKMPLQCPQVPKVYCNWPCAQP